MNVLQLNPTTSESSLVSPLPFPGKTYPYHRYSCILGFGGPISENIVERSSVLRPSQELSIEFEICPRHTIARHLASLVAATIIVCGSALSLGIQ